MLKGFKDFIMRGNVVDLAVGIVIGAALNFIVVFPMNKLAERRRRGQEPPPEAPSEEVRLLTDIRDLLAAREAPARPRTPLDQPTDVEQA